MSETKNNNMFFDDSSNILCGFDSVKNELWAQIKFPNKDNVPSVEDFMGLLNKVLWEYRNIKINPVTHKGRNNEEG